RPEPADVAVEDGVRGSRGGPRKGADALRYRAGILKVDILRGDLHIAQRGLDVGVTHQVHECGQAHAGENHIRSKGVTKPVWVCQLDTGGAAMVAEQGA